MINSRLLTLFAALVASAPADCYGSLIATEAEWFAAMVAAREGMYFRDLLTELGISLLGATALRSDNKSVKELSLDSIAFKKTKHILRAANFLRDQVVKLVVVLKHVPGSSNVADILTKAPARAVFTSLLKLLDNHLTPSSEVPSLW